MPPREKQAPPGLFRHALEQYDRLTSGKQIPATDIVFCSPEDLKPLYEVMVRTAIHAVKPEHVATFLGRKLDEHSCVEVGNDFHTRIEGTRIKHHLGRNSIKMYDKLGRVLRIETTSND